MAYRLLPTDSATPSGANKIAGGFSLIEVMIALLVLSIGLLGLAALQTFGIKYNQQSYQRTQAIYQAYDIIDRIRANPTGKTAGCYDTVAAGATATVAPCAVAYVDCTAAACDTSQLANYDVRSWNTTNGLIMAQGRGAIATAGTRRTVTITWIEDDLPSRLVIEVDL